MLCIQLHNVLIGTAHIPSPKGTTCSPGYRTMPLNFLLFAKFFLNHSKCLKCDFLTADPALTSIPRTSPFMFSIKNVFLCLNYWGYQAFKQEEKSENFAKLVILAKTCLFCWNIAVFLCSISYLPGKTMALLFYL